MQSNDLEIKKFKNFDKFLNFFMLFSQNVQFYTIVTVPHKMSKYEKVCSLSFEIIVKTLG